MCFRSWVRHKKLFKKTHADKIAFVIVGQCFCELLGTNLNIAVRVLLLILKQYSQGWQNFLC